MADQNNQLLGGALFPFSEMARSTKPLLPVTSIAKSIRNVFSASEEKTMREQQRAKNAAGYEE